MRNGFLAMDGNLTGASRSKGAEEPRSSGAEIRRPFSSAPLLLCSSALFLCFCGRAGGGEPGACGCGGPCSGLRQPCLSCPDDYCRKKLPPCPCSVRCCGPDDYCRKKLPIC